MPLKFATCGVLVALSFIVSEPAIEPLIVGANFTWMLQLPPGANAVVHVLVWVKPALVTILLTLSDDVPLLLRVTVFAPLVVPTPCLLKLRLVGFTEPIAIGVGVAVGVRVAVGVPVLVAVAVVVAVGVAVRVAVGVGVAVRVAVAVAVGVGVGVAVGGGGPPAPNAITEAE